RIACPPPSKRLRISELNPHLLCALCGGYLIDATTIIECLHSFCKTCILRYLETSTYCPICEVLIHKTRPWQNIRLDHSLQNAVYKMVPGLFQDEMRRRREFYEKQNQQDKRGRSRSQLQGEFGDRIIFSRDEEFSISIEFSPDGKPVKEVKESKSKSLKRTNAIIDLFHEAEPLSETYSLMDVAYIYHWKRDCVLRLFYSFFEIPPKVRKVETVTHVTEKISKNKLMDKSEEKSDKREDDKKSKNKRERSKEKKQSKLSGKRKVCAEGSALVADSAVILGHSPCAETVEPGSMKSLGIEVVAAASTVHTADDVKPVDTSSKATRNNITSLSVVKCSKKDHTTFQSPTKQKPPPESPPFSITTHSANKDNSKVSKGHKSKTSIKLLIKSSDIKVCKSPDRQFLGSTVDVKYENNDMPTKVKIRKYQNGESASISQSNLFEKMSTLANSSEMELKDHTLISKSFSSHDQNKVYSNSKTPRDDEFLKREAKAKVNIATVNAASQQEELVDKKRTDSKLTGKVVVKEDVEALNRIVNNLEDTKLEKCNSGLQNKVDFGVGGKDGATNIQANKQETKVITKTASQSKSDCKTHIHSGKSSGSQSTTFSEDKKAAHNMQQNAHDVSRTQDSNQNDIKLGHEHGNDMDNLKENGMKSPNCDSKLLIVKTEPSITTEDVHNRRKLCESVNQTRTQQSMSEAKQVSVPPEKNIARRALEDSNKHNGKQNRDDSIRADSEPRGLLDTNLAVLPKANPAVSDTSTALPKIHNGLTKAPEIIRVQSPVKMMQVQELSKTVRDTEGREPLCSSNKKALIERGSVSLQSDDKQQTSSPCSDKLVDVSKPVTLEITSVGSSVTPKIGVILCEVSSAETNTSSQPAFVSGVLTTTTSSSPLSAPPKLLKTMVISTAGTASYPLTAYSIASIVSVPVFKPGSIPSSSFTAVSQALLTPSPAATTNAAPKLSEVVTTTVPHKAALPVVCTTTLTKTSLSAPVTSSVSATMSASTVGSGAPDSTSSPASERSSESGSPSPLYRGNQPGSAYFGLHTSTKTTASVCVPSAASRGSVTNPTATPSLVLPVTVSPTTSSLSSTPVVTTQALTVTSSATSTWCTETTVNVANTFLNIPPKESAALKNTQTKSNSRVSNVSASSMTLQKDAINLDNFLFDTKPSETESLTALSGHRMKDTCTISKQIHKGPLRTKSNSSAQAHGLVNSRAVTSAEPHITAVHQLPKTVSHTSKPYSVGKSLSVSSTSSAKCNSVIQTTKISTLIPKSTSVTSKAGAFSKSFSYPSTLNSVPSSRSFLHTSLPPHMPRPDLSAVINGSSAYEQALLTKASGLSSSSSSVHMTSAASSSSSHHRTSSKHISKDADGKMEKTQKNKAVPPLTIPKSCLTTLKLQRSPGSTDHYIFAPLTHYTAAGHHNGERSKSKEVKYNGSRTPTSPPTPTRDSVFIGERQRVPTIKISDINRNPIIVESGGSNLANTNRHHSQFRSYNHGSSRSSSSDSGSARAHSRAGSDSNSPTGSSDRSDRSPARDARRPSDSELLLSQHWHSYTAADLLFNGFKLPSHPKFHELHYDTDAMPLDYSQSSSKS
ncbi:unnamed protein product, partial [Candidula unifasciata]